MTHDVAFHSFTSPLLAASSKSTLRPDTTANYRYTSQLIRQAVNITLKHLVSVTLPLSVYLSDSSKMPTPKHRHKPKMTQQGARPCYLLCLPIEVRTNITKRLEPVDIACLALTCHHLRDELHIEDPRQRQYFKFSVHRAKHQFLWRLKIGWVGPDLQWCMGCNYFLPKDAQFWQDKGFPTYSVAVKEFCKEERSIERPCPPCRWFGYVRRRRKWKKVMTVEKMELV